MVDYVFARKTRNVSANILYVFLNILLGLGVVLATVFSANPAIGIILILISKWRVFAIRKRYFWLNIKSNLADIIVGLSIVLLSHYAGNSLMFVHFVLIAVYIIWLLFIKPLSNEKGILTQSVVMTFLGISATTIMTAGLDAIFAVSLAFLIGYVASRHVLSQTNDKDFILTTLICGLVFSEVAWLCHLWSIIYVINFPFETGIRIPQVTIILTIFTFIYNYARQAMLRYREDFRFRNIIGPVIFGTVLISIIVLWFSNPAFNI